MRLLTGTYTSDGRSEGIYSLEEGEVKALGGRCVNPSFLCTSKDMLYGVNEQQECGQLSAWRMEENGALCYVNSVSVPGMDTCHLQADRRRRTIYAANYTDGSVFVCAIREDGRLGEIRQQMKLSGHGPNKERQEGPHAHCTVLSPDERFLFVADLGTDRVYSYQVGEDGILTENPKAPFWQADPGEGPRHLLFSEDGSFAWLITEMGCSVYLLAYDAENGSFEKRQMVHLLKEESQQKEAAAAELALSPDGKFLYASVRFEDMLVGFSVGEGGALTRIGEFDNYGRTPRHFSISRDGRQVFIANQDSDQVVVCERDTVTGKLGNKVAEYGVPMPVCVLPQYAADEV